jgi:hypothetical protein
VQRFRLTTFMLPELTAHGARGFAAGAVSVTDLSFHGRDPAPAFVRADDRFGEHQRPPAGADGYGRWAARSQCGEQFVDVSVEGGVEAAVGVVEVTGLPDLGGLVLGALEAVAADGVVDEDPSRGAVEPTRWVSW